MSKYFGNCKYDIHYDQKNQSLYCQIKAKEPTDTAKQEIIQLIKYEQPFLKQVVLQYEEIPEIVIYDRPMDSIQSTPVVEMTPSRKTKGRRSKKNIVINHEGVLIGKKIRKDIVPADAVSVNIPAALEGQLVSLDVRELRNANYLYKMIFASEGTGFFAKVFLNEASHASFESLLKTGQWYKVFGMPEQDPYENNEIVISIDSINEIEAPLIRKDVASKKRIELHAHTNMSEMDALTSVNDLIARAKAWGHPGIAITDHATTQSLFSAYQHAEDNFKVISGVEIYLADDTADMVRFLPVSQQSDHLMEEMIVFDIETTGFGAKNEEIIEIGAIKIKDGVIKDQYETFVKPTKKIPAKITEITGITDAMVQHAPDIDEALLGFKNFIGNRPLVAHNASFDMSFMNIQFSKRSWPLPNAVIDTIDLARQLLKTKKYNLGTVCKELGIVIDQRHRAGDDARGTAFALIKMFEMLEEKSVHTLGEVNDYFKQHYDVKNMPVNHATILVKNNVGLRHLYELMTQSNIEDFYIKPKVSKKALIEKREGLLIGSAGEFGEVYRSFIFQQQSSVKKEIMSFYDYVEIIPPSVFTKLYHDGWVSGEEEMQVMTKQILQLADSLKKPVAAVSECHFLDEEDQIGRSILLDYKGFNELEYDAPLYFRTTDEMLASFDFLEDRAEEVVIDNPLAIAEQTSCLRPLDKALHPPVIEHSDEILRESCYAKTKRIYGEEIPEIIAQRLERELESIISHGYSVLYISAKKLVEKSESDGYIVGSRGSVGSSFAAFASDISEVNPLPPHYICEHCHTADFDVDTTLYETGIDLPPRICPICGAPLSKNGFNIPFETFLGFEGDKEPDIDLNFASVYQKEAHNYCGELFGEGKTFKAGTIGTVADKTAFGYVMKYLEARNMSWHRGEIERIKQKIIGVKRASGQHPGGIMVVPKDNDINEFTPVQFAQTGDERVLTTHYDYDTLHGTLLKLDILGHESPTVLRILQDIAGISLEDIPLNDPDTLALFKTVEPLGLKEPGREEVGTLGIPEFGTRFVRSMLIETKPQSMADLVRISGLSHGTNVWSNNAQDLVRAGTVSLRDVISTREDIMNLLIQNGFEKKNAFLIMEKVRKGRGLSEDEIIKMKEHKMPEWYIDSCLKIKYLFPKAHAAAYVMQSFKIAYFKVHHPMAYYAAIFSQAVEDFNSTIIAKGEQAVLDRMEMIEGNVKQTAKDKAEYYILEIAYEMLCRGITILPVNIMTSEAVSFKIKDQSLLAPLASIPGVGVNAAKAIVEARQDVDEYISIEDFKDQTGSNKTVIQALKEVGAFSDLSDTNQLSLF